MNPTLQRKGLPVGPRHKKGELARRLGEREPDPASDPLLTRPARGARTASRCPSPARTPGAADESPGGCPGLLELFQPARGHLDTSAVLGVWPSSVCGLLLAPRADPDGAPVHELSHAARFFADGDLGGAFDVPFRPRFGPEPASLTSF